MKKNTEIYSILFCGTGGQGVLAASEVAGMAAMNAGYHVKKSEVHGMAQRGGSVESHLRFGAAIASPLIMPGQADFLVSFWADESKRMSGFLKKGGMDFTPLLSRDLNLPDNRFLNTFILGVLASKLPVAKEHWFDAIEKVIRKRLDENRKVFVDGMELGAGLE